ncbi:BnaC01g00630D [Brassica napus]|uniref:BnaC01g00630D protein n=1 Tax=Brassica napus TaxID=3708 RepID=A0A078HY82_BRANA|nr:BnaC01g00630D [Brassica napus]
MNLEVEPPCKKKKQEEPSHPSFLSLPDVIILNCLARVSKSYYPKLSLVSKTFRSLILSIELNHARFHHKTNEISFHVCLQLPDRPLPSYWFTLLIDLEMKKSTLAQVPSIYAPIVPRIMLTVASQVYALRQFYHPSPVMIVRNKENLLWRKAPSLTVARSNPGACVLDGKIYVVGGCTANDCWGEVFDTKTQTWEPLPDPGTELRFSSVIRKLEIIQGKIYVRSNEEKDSVYDPKKREWNVAAKALVGDSRCAIGNLLYSCGRKSCMWYDSECKEWKPVKGLSSLNKSCRRGLIETVNLNGKLIVLWNKFARPGPHCQNKTICCALVALEKRQDGQVWGNVEWSNDVLRVPSSYLLLRSSIILS